MKKIIDNIKQLILDSFDSSKHAEKLIYKTLRYRRNNRKLISRIYQRQLLRKYNIHVGFNVELGKNLSLPHPIGIVIGHESKIGNNCTIYQHCTLGKKNTKELGSSDYPELGDNVTLYAGSILVGDIKIGNNSIIAPNSVVITDVPENTVYSGVPAKEIKKLS